MSSISMYCLQLFIALFVHNSRRHDSRIIAETMVDFCISECMRMAGVHRDELIETQPDFLALSEVRLAPEPLA